jgi:hypothetical protein
MASRRPRLLVLALLQVSTRWQPLCRLSRWRAGFWLLVSRPTLTTPRRPAAAVLAGRGDRRRAGAGLAATWAWIFIRWAFALPACVLHG